MNVAIIGCGLIGKKRAKALQGDALVAVCDTDESRARGLAAEFSGATVYTEWSACLRHPGLQAVVIATTHDKLPVITTAAIEAGLAVLVEKPAGRNPEELATLAQFAGDRKAVVRVGFNHRYHPAFRQIREITARQDFGPLMFIRGRYGHGGRLGMEKEWRGQPELSGGGELIDQGVHLIDLSRQWLKDVTFVQGWSHRYFWDMPVEDNGFLLLRNAADQAAFLQVSCTEWKNLFSFEIYFKTAKFDVSGLGGSYGVERLAFYRMRPEMGPPDAQTFEYPVDDSWAQEWLEFRADVAARRTPNANLDDALAAMQVVYETYRQSKEIQC